MRAALLVALAATAVSQTPLTTQPCTGAASEIFKQEANTVLNPALNQCIGFADSNVVVQQCSGALNQQWTFNSDGTVESVGTPGQCWNVNGGGTSQNTSIIMYQCDSLQGRIAANDVFKWSGSTIVAVEAKMCLSTAFIPPPPPPPPGQCKTDLDCALNGACNGGKCACYPPWTGDLSCLTLSFLPTPVERGYPPAAQNETTWGGSIALSAADGLYHMFVAEMMNECPLSTWGQNSRCTHAVANTPEGPFTFADVAVQNWCHNPQVVVQTFSNGSTLWALFHIGDGTGGSTKNCTSGVVIGDSTETAVDPSVVGSSLHVASSPNGPWTPVSPNPLPSCNNPAPWLAANGTWYLVCNGFSLYTAASVFGPWTSVTGISAGGGIAGSYEDPFLFIDARGNWHVIYHVYRTSTDGEVCTAGHDGAVVAGHFYSPDGYTWYEATQSPYTNLIALDNGAVQLVSTRERPKLLFNAAGEPTHLSNGVCAALTCPPTPCVNCKYNFWDFTNVSPLAV